MFATSSLRSIYRLGAMFIAGLCLVPWLAFGSHSETEALDTGESSVLHIDSGNLKGEVLDADASLRVFRGIPFASPPVGDLRWRPPAPPAPWQGERDATEFGAICPQLPMLASLTGEVFPATSEDCLFLNVWTTAEQGATLPVMVWIHGGGLAMGWSNQVGYEGSAFAKKGVVLVTVNYRLGALGFLAHPELSKEEDGASGNYGFLDQIAALEWVKRNVAQFGGDPNNVTIFGESAGGTSVHALAASPMAKGLFHRAITQSAWITETNIVHLEEDSPTVASGEKLGAAWAKHATGSESSSAAELRALDVQTIVQKSGQQDFQPAITIDGRFMPASSELRFTSGDYNQVPLLAGTNADEGTMFQAFMPVRDRADFLAMVEGIYGKQGPTVAGLYPSDSPEELKVQMNRFLTDTWFVRATRNMLIASNNVSVPSSQYHFTRPSPVQKAWGAHHAAELNYVFNTLDEKLYDATDLKLAGAMIQYWVQFAKTGDPNVEGLPAWPRFDEKTQGFLELNGEISTGEKLCQTRCDRLEEILRGL